MKLIEINEQAYVPVENFYAGKSVFVTGATGFLGKVLIEKLLYSCPGIQTIYIMIREKSNENISERMKNLIENPIFTRIRNKRPKDLRKIVPISGDITAPGLGINIYNKEKLINEVSVVFHLAATVNFNESLTAAMDINLEGARKIIALCKYMKKLKVLIHISTAYINTNREGIDEIIYPPPRKLSEVYEFVQRFGDNEEKTTNILSGQPNTYTFTKALAENLLADIDNGFPTVIIRPSIVTPSLNEPLRGWIDNWNGATGIFTIIAKGACRVVLGSDNNILDLIPVDYVSNLTLLSAARLHSSKGVTVLNSCTGSVNPITLKEIATLYTKESIRDGFNDLPFPGALLLTNKTWLVKLITIIEKTIASTIDLILRIVGKKPRFVKIQQKSEKVRNVLSYFTSHSWLFKCERACELYNTLNEHDRRVFPCNPKDIDWKLYMPIYFQGVKQYLIQKNFN